MDPITFVLSIAYSVVAGITVDMVTGKRKSALKTDIEQEVARKVAQEVQKTKIKPTEQEIQRIIHRTVEEINNLVQESSDLKSLPETIALQIPIRKPILPLFQKEILRGK
ncbi:MAG: hypothetical protein HC917_28485 [Richelia sp. SM2_1_7]|nr:hypothetical protein [Richelia sp. SM2_1_7]